LFRKRGGGKRKKRKATSLGEGRPYRNETAHHPYGVATGGEPTEKGRSPISNFGTEKKNTLTRYDLDSHREKSSGTRRPRQKEKKKGKEGKVTLSP